MSECSLLSLFALYAPLCTWLAKGLRWRSLCVEVPHVCTAPFQCYMIANAQLINLHPVQTNRFKANPTTITDKTCVLSATVNRDANPKRPHFPSLQVITLTRSLAAAGKLPELGIGFARELLLVALDLIHAAPAAAAAALRGSAAAAGGAASGHHQIHQAQSRGQLLRELREVPLLPQVDGSWASASGLVIGSSLAGVTAGSAGPAANGGTKGEVAGDGGSLHTSSTARVFLPLRWEDAAAASTAATAAVAPVNPGVKGGRGGAGTLGRAGGLAGDALVGGGAAARATREALAKSGLGEGWLAAHGAGGADDGSGGGGGLGIGGLRLVHPEFLVGTEDDTDRALLLRGLLVSVSTRDLIGWMS